MACIGPLALLLNAMWKSEQIQEAQGPGKSLQAPAVVAVQERRKGSGGDGTAPSGRPKRTPAKVTVVQEDNDDDSRCRKGKVAARRKQSRGRCPLASAAGEKAGAQEWRSYFLRGRRRVLMWNVLCLAARRHPLGMTC